MLQSDSGGQEDIEVKKDAKNERMTKKTSVVMAYPTAEDLLPWAVKNWKVPALL